MIPIELTIEGLYSYQERQTIDFRKLTTAGLFGIFGTVGSGKSSILEAITYAIYGKTDKLNISGDNRYYNMMNLKSNEIFIDFIFETGKNQTAYRAIVRGKRNRKRFEEVKTLEHTAYKKINNEWIPIGINDLENAVGLSFVNFKRTIIIPQGQFQEFLQLGNKDRTTMMKELFNLQKFEFYYKVVSLENKNNEKKNNINGQIQQLGPLNIEQVYIYKQQLLNIEKSIEDLNVDITEFQKEEEQLRSFKSLILKKDEVEILLNKLIQKEPEFLELKKRTDRYELCVMSFKHLLDSLDDYLEKKKNRENSIKLDNLTLISHNNKIKELKKTLEDLKPHYDKREEIKLKANELNIILKIKNLANSVIETTSSVEKGTEYWNNTNLIVINLKKEKISLEEILQDLRNKMPDVTLLTKIKTWYNEKNILDRQILEIERDLQKYLSREKELNNQKNILLEEPILKGKIINEWSFKKCNQHLELVSIRIKNRQNELNKQERHVLVKARLKDYAENLKDNVPCPLCGSLHHPEIFKSEDIEKLLEKIKEDKNDIEKDLNTISSISMQLNMIEISHNDTVYQIKELQKSKRIFEQGIAAHNDLFTWKQFKKVEELDSTFSEMEKIQVNIKSNETELQQKIKELNKQDDILERASKKLEVLKNSLTIHKTELKTLIQQLKIIKYDDYKEKSDSFINDKRINILKEYELVEKQYTTDNKLLQEEKRKRDLLNGKLEANIFELEKELSTIKKIESKIESELIKSEFSSIEEIKTIILQSINIRQEKKRIEEFNNNLLKCKSTYDQLQKDVGERIYDSNYHDNLVDKIQLKNNQLTAFNKEHGKITELLRTLQKNIKTQTVLRENLQEIELRSENLKIMKNLFKASGFVNYISTIYLQNLCNAANDKFFQLTRQKMSLKITPDNNFQIRDFMNGGKERSIKTLSGGQTFQASLSLALALADNIQKITESNQNFFFLDEGFGSLDKESLDIVFNTLKSLRKENRIIGIISHVEEMQQEIDIHIRIENDAEHGSIIHSSWEV